MKGTFYALLATVGILLGTPAPHAAGRSLLTENPAETQHKAAAEKRIITAKNTAARNKSVTHSVKESKHKVRYAMMVLLGLAESKSVTSPLKRQWQLHAHQRQLKKQVRMASRARRKRAHE